MRVKCLAQEHNTVTLARGYQVVSPDGAFARRRFARSQSRFARRKSRFARTKSRFARTNKILVDQVYSYCYWKQTSMNHAAYGHFDLSRVSCVQTLSIDTSVIRIPFLVFVVHIIVLVMMTFYVWRLRCQPDLTNEIYVIPFETLIRAYIHEHLIKILS